MCSDGSTKSATDVAPLRSLPCVASGTPAAEAAIVGRQKAHHDPSNLEPDELARFGLKPLSELPDMDQPVSAMLAVQEGTSLWIFPGGCDPAAADAAFLLPDVDVGDVIVWRGAHAGKGYAEEHYRWHGYVDPPPHIYRRPQPVTTDVCRNPMLPGAKQRAAAAAGVRAEQALQALARQRRTRASTTAAGSQESTLPAAPLARAAADEGNQVHAPPPRAQRNQRTPAPPARLPACMRPRG